MMETEVGQEERCSVKGKEKIGKEKVNNPGFFFFLLSSLHHPLPSPVSPFTRSLPVSVAEEKLEEQHPRWSGF